MAVTAKRDWIERGLGQDVPDADRARIAAMLAGARPKREPEAYAPPIGVDPDWEAVPVGLESIEAPIPQADLDAAALEDYGAAFGSPRANVPAAQRAQLREPNDHGVPTRMAVLVAQRGITRKAIVTGTPAEIRQALPDADTIDRWKELGVVEVPCWSMAPGPEIHQKLTWVPIGQAPVLLRMESVERAASV